MILIPPPKTGFFSKIEHRLAVFGLIGLLLIVGLAVNLLDPAKIPEPDLETAVSYSLAQEDPQYCEHLTDTEQVFSCYTQLTEQLKTHQGCQQLPLDEFHDECLTRLSVEQQNVSLCALIKSRKSGCLEKHK